MKFMLAFIATTLSGYIVQKYGHEYSVEVGAVCIVMGFIVSKLFDLINKK